MSTQNTATDTGVDETAVLEARSIKTVYVYEAPVRAWHWLNALAIMVMAVTGYFIGSPLPSGPGEASNSFVMGYIRFVHFAAAYVFTFGFIARLYWSLVGNSHSRELVTLPAFSARFWKEIVVMIQWYLFLRPQPNQYVGHNPLARLMMFVGFFFGGVFMLSTGWALYGEGAQAGHWSHKLFTSWVIPLFGQSQDVHTWHHLSMWVIVTFIIVHVYAAVREDIMGRQSIISTMVSGYRTFKN